jgi:RNA polymerase sigma-70 factor (ECF subfamily)
MEPPEETFRRAYVAHFDAVLGYALRRTDRAEDAADVVGETFLVAWRRSRHVPPEPDTRPWLYGVARRVLANQRRGDLRRRRLGERLRHDLAAVVPDHSDGVAARNALEEALSRLSGRDEEILQLHLWEGLESREIAEVLGLPAAVVRPRLSRARARLRDLLGNEPVPAGHLPGTDPVMRPSAVTVPEEGR